MGGWPDFLRRLLGWLSSPPTAPVVGEPRVISIQGRADTTLSVVGQDDTTITVRGSHAVAIHRNIEFFRGETVSIVVEVDGETSLTGRTFRLAINSPAGTLLLALTQASGITVDSPVGGSLTCAITATQSAALAAGRDIWGVAETTAGGQAVLADGYCGVLSAPPLPPP